MKTSLHFRPFMRKVKVVKIQPARTRKQSAISQHASSLIASSMAKVAKVPPTARAKAKMMKRTGMT